MTQFDDSAIAADYDDMKVDEFANAMKAKMAKKRDEGRGGWDDPAQCSIEHLANLLISHIEKGDPVDIANFCMMLFHRKGSNAVQQAACDHYAPKLTEKEAIDKAFKAANPLIAVIADSGLPPKRLEMPQEELSLALSMQ